jgi:hypothetical protein
MRPMTIAPLVERGTGMIAAAPDTEQRFMMIGVVVVLLGLSLLLMWRLPLGTAHRGEAETLPDRTSDGDTPR